ncbi:MAG: ATP-binding protein [Actinomycetota bacterium]|nr:ATP-binding protein [Actinomycetota bacterium]MDA2971672.1 ATP-binding protein [Actinomycetota bacterium]MDA3001372.1 ATP-binding protein [Actinomycetota bacterium]
MRFSKSSAESVEGTFVDAVVELLARNAEDGTRHDTGDIESHQKALVRSDEPVVSLARAIGCTDDEVAALVLLVHVERSLERQRVLAGPDGDGSIRLGMLDQITHDAFRGAATVGPDSRLRRARLVAVSPNGPFASRPVRVDTSVLWGLSGDSRPDPNLPLGSRLVDRGENRGEHTSLLVVGDDPTRRRTLLLNELAGHSVLVVRDPSDSAHWDAAVREASLSGSSLLIELSGSLTPMGSAVLDDANHLVIGLSTVAGIDPELLPRRSWKEMSAPSSPATTEEVDAVLGRESPHPLTADQLRRVHSTLPLVDGDLSRAVRRLADHRLFELGNRTSPSRTWDDLVVESECLEELQHLADRYRQASRVRELPGVGRHVPPGLLAVFAGPSGTGKTLAAEVIAGDLGLELVKIDLSTVVSKYIGETEKNLEEVFDAASVGGALVLFDEGDAIFGKRSETTDARDRYANIEVAYLLQRVETFEGFVIISTNLAANVDQAFQRRIQGMVEFMPPDRELRRRLWELHLPSSLCHDVDHDELSAINVAGGNIRNVSVAAAFLAAADEQPIGRHHLRLALRREMRKLGRLAEGLLP